jgi:hypothetical protein
MLELDWSCTLIFHDPAKCRVLGNAHLRYPSRVPPSLLYPQKSEGSICPFSTCTRANKRIHFFRPQTKHSRCGTRQKGSTFLASYTINAFSKFVTGSVLPDRRVSDHVVRRTDVSPSVATCVASNLSVHSTIH